MCAPHYASRQEGVESEYHMHALKEFREKTFSSLAVRNYRIYFFGQGISQSGTWMQVVATGWLVLQLTGSGTVLGTVLALMFLPLLFGAPWGGLLVDRLDKRRILVWTQSCFGILSLLISILVFSGAIQIWMVYVFALLTGIVKVFDNPARQTFISEMVGTEHLKNAVSLNSTMANLARAIGPTIGGILIAGVGIAFCFLIDALSYGAVLWTLSRIQVSELIRAPIVQKKRPKLSDGFRYVRSEPLISTILIMMGIIGIFAYEFSVSLPIIAKQTFHGDATVYAILTSTFGAGCALGGIFAAGRHRVSSKQLVTFALLFGLALIAASLSPTLPTMVFALAIAGFFSINMTSTANTTIQLESRPEMRGRVMALWSMAIFGSTPIGGPLIGYIGEHFGARWGLATGGIATVFAAALAAHTLSKRGALVTVPPEIELEIEEAADTPKF